MKKLTYNGFNYSLNNTKQFKSMGQILENQLIDCIRFATNMTFGKQGEHRANRSGGQTSRKMGQIFANTLQGKIAEYAIYNTLMVQYPDITPPDLETYELGEWDNADFIIENTKLSIKSTKYYGQLILLETKDWDLNGCYIPNMLKDNKGYYDYFILVRVQTEIESIMKKHRLLYADQITQEQFDTLVHDIINSDWNYDIPGFIDHNDLVEVINLKHIIPRGAQLGTKTPMDAENYYIQAGDLKDISLIQIK